MYSLAALPTLAWAWYYYHRRRTAPRAWRHVGTATCCLDAASIEDAVVLVRRCAGGASDACAIAERLERVYDRFPPDERLLRRLSTFQQLVEGEGGEREFCVVTVYMIASLCAARAPPGTRRVERIARSLPSRRTKHIQGSNHTKHNASRRHGAVVGEGGRPPVEGRDRVLSELGPGAKAQTAPSDHKLDPESLPAHDLPRPSRSQSMPTMRSSEEGTHVPSQGGGGGGGRRPAPVADAPVVSTTRLAATVAAE